MSRLPPLLVAVTLSVCLWRIPGQHMVYAEYSNDSFDSSPELYQHGSDSDNESNASSLPLGAEYDDDKRYDYGGEHLDDSKRREVVLAAEHMRSGFDYEPSSGGSDDFGDAGVSSTESDAGDLRDQLHLDYEGDQCERSEVGSRAPSRVSLPTSADDDDALLADLGDSRFHMPDSARGSGTPGTRDGRVHLPPVRGATTIGAEGRWLNKDSPQIFFPPVLGASGTTGFRDRLPDSSRTYLPRTTDSYGGIGGATDWINQGTYGDESYYRGSERPDSALLADDQASVDAQLESDGYSKGALLGKGTFGEVYEGQSRKYGRVALKFGVAATANDLQDAKMEVHLARKICDKNAHGADKYFARGHAFIEGRENSRGTPYCQVLEFGGPTIMEARQRGQLLWEDMPELISQLVEGLNAINRAGYSHHDLKPDNVGVTVVVSGREERTLAVKIYDLGALTSCVGGDSKRRGEQRPLTPYFAPPEAPDVIFSSPCESFDVYALGATLAALLFNRDNWGNFIVQSSFVWFIPVGAKKLAIAQQQFPENLREKGVHMLTEKSLLRTKKQEDRRHLFDEYFIKRAQCVDPNSAFVKGFLADVGSEPRGPIAAMVLDVLWRCLQSNPGDRPTLVALVKLYPAQASKAVLPPQAQIGEIPASDMYRTPYIRAEETYETREEKRERLRRTEVERIEKLRARRGHGKGRRMRGQAGLKENGEPLVGKMFPPLE